MRLTFALLLIATALVTPALAKSHGSILPSGSAIGKAATTPPNKIQALCDQIIADQNKSKVAMADAGHLYFQGKLMGQSCVKIDYVKALTLLRKAGDGAEFNAVVRILRDRAAGGNASAIAALAKVDLSALK